MFFSFYVCHYAGVFLPHVSVFIKISTLLFPAAHTASLASSFCSAGQPVATNSRRWFLESSRGQISTKFYLHHSNFSYSGNHSHVFSSEILVSFLSGRWGDGELLLGRSISALRGTGCPIYLPFLHFLEFSLHLSSQTLASPIPCYN